MIIIIEGPDASGKSTLAAKLSNDMGFEVKHFSYPKSEEEKASMFDMYADFIRNNRNVILDRCWYSEMVYGNTVRNGSAITIEQMHELENIVADNGGGMIIHCNASIEALWARFASRGDDYIPIEYDLVRKLKAGYDVIFETINHNLPVLKYEI